MQPSTVSGLWTLPESVRLKSADAGMMFIRSQQAQHHVLYYPSQSMPVSTVSRLTQTRMAHAREIAQVESDGLAPLD